MGQKEIIRYSKAFKLKIVRELELGESIAELRRKYDIAGSDTIQHWLRRYGRNELLNKIVRVEMKSEKDKLKKLEEEKRALESALSKLAIQNQVYEAIFEVYAEDNGYELKKNYGIEELKELMKKPPKKAND